jgi:hypothetical protein
MKEEFKTEDAERRKPAGEIARALGYTRQHFISLCRAGDVPCAKQTKGGHWRIYLTPEFSRWYAGHPRNAAKGLRTDGNLASAVVHLTDRERALKDEAKAIRAKLREVRRRIDELQALRK